MIDLPNVIELNVTQEDIDASLAECKDLCRHCVVGRALNRQIPQYIGYAFNTNVGFYDIPTKYQHSKKYRMCEVGQLVVKKYNAFEPENGMKLDVQPCVITLTVI